MSIDTLLPLSLIINELVSNALKYAFSENKKGEIKIELFEKKEYFWIHSASRSRTSWETPV